MLIDTHCHLDFPELASQRDDVLARAHAAGVERMITISTHKSRFAVYQKIAAEFPHIFCTAGVHPHHTAEAGEDITAAELVAAAANPKVVGLGETGLDYYYNHSDRDAQVRAFEAHIEAAQETGLPLIIHTRDADKDTAALLTSAYKQKAMNGLLHCFTSGMDLALQALDIGFYISFSGIVTFKNAESIRETAKAVPLNRILVETDAPYLAPVPERGKVNEPSFVRHTAQYLADLKGMPLADFAAQTSANARTVFKRLV